MQAAASNARSAFSLGTGHGVRVGRRAGRHRDEASGRDDAIERAAVDDEVAQHGERRGAPGLDRQRVAVLERAHVQLAGGRAVARAVRAAVDDDAAGAADALAAVVVERDGSSPRAISDSFSTSSISRKDMSGETSSTV
jgi:hypothetical protein